MSQPLEQLKTKFSLDPVHDGRHRLRDDPRARESLVFMLQLPEENIAAFAYTWDNGESTAGAALCVFGHGAGSTPLFERIAGIPIPREQCFDDRRGRMVHGAHGAALQTAAPSYCSAARRLQYYFAATPQAYH